MKKFILFCLIAIFQFNTAQAVMSVKHVDVESPVYSKTQMPSAFGDMDMDEFMAMSPKEYRKKTGKRLGLKKSIQLKLAQKMMKRAQKKAERAADNHGISKGIYILLAIFSLAWIALGLFEDWKGSVWIINLILYFLFWLPGLIHSLIVMKNYY